MVREIVRAHGGEVRLDSAIGRGKQVHLGMAVGAVQPRRSGDRHDAHPRRRRRAGDRARPRGRSDARGIAVEVVQDGAAAAKRARETTFDLIVLDVMLPGKDGFEVVPRAAPRRRPYADHHAHGARAGGREGARARPRRRRLRHEAVRPSRAARADRGAAAPQSPEARPPACGSARRRSIRARRDQARRSDGPAHAARVPHPSGVHPGARADSHARAAHRRGLGANSSFPIAWSTITSAACGENSNRTRRNHATCGMCGVSGNGWRAKS